MDAVSELRARLLEKKAEQGCLNDMERCALYHADYHEHVNGLWYCLYCANRRAHAMVDKAKALKLRMGISYDHSK